MSADQWLRQRELLGEGQKVLEGASALVVGCGGLGAGAIPALVASGVGRVVLMDDDVLDLTNLNRQTLYTTDDLGAEKVERATARMAALSPSTRVEGLHRRLSADDADFVQDFDVVLDCTDMMASRAAISASCRSAGVPWVWAAVDGWRGVLSVFVPGGVQWEDVVGDASELGRRPQVLGATPAMLGAWQAAEAIKLLSGQGHPVSGRLAVVDLLAGTVREVPLSARRS
ncbi:MAG TPA: HesA/MoeB/ThiF family protein [Candidatus Luteococcus avicola]|nr:HesA/MoeB/ThiF family protein [Candidatus Luteococcus avicola]